MFPAARGGYIDLEKSGFRECPALCAAGIDHRALRDGVGLSLLSRIMGTSIQRLDNTYGHLLGDAEDSIRGLLDAGDGVRGLSVDEAADSN